MKLKHYAIGGMALSLSVLTFISGPVAAQGQSASAAAMLEQVIVTARRREENLQELPLSVQAITADAMTAQGIYNLEQITEFVPNVVLTEDQRKNDTRFFVRGIGGGFPRDRCAGDDQYPDLGEPLFPGQHRIGEAGWVLLQPAYQQTHQRHGPAEPGSGIALGSGGQLDDRHAAFRRAGPGRQRGRSVPAASTPGRVRSVDRRRPRRDPRETKADCGS